MLIKLKNNYKSNTLGLNILGLVIILQVVPIGYAGTCSSAPVAPEDRRTSAHKRAITTKTSAASAELSRAMTGLKAYDQHQKDIFAAFMLGRQEERAKYTASASTSVAPVTPVAHVPAIPAPVVHVRRTSDEADLS